MKGKELVYYRHFGKALKKEMFDALINDLMKEAFGKAADKVEYHDYYKYRLSYITEKEHELLFLFVTGLTDNFDNIKKELIKCKKEFLNLFEDILQHKFDAKTFEVFDPTIDSIHRNLRPKISLVGFSGVGKTTITRLIKAEEIPMQHIPTITGDIATIKIGKLHFHLWDFAGQEQFSYLWNNFIKGSDAVLLITDSTLENVEKSKFFLELIKEQAPQAHTAVIGNKQDLENAMKPDQIEKILGLKSYSMIAKEAKNRDKMIQIIADILEMSAEVSPLLKPLLERDVYTEEATKALENAEFEKAATYFEKISDLCIELGDDSLGKEFYEKAQKIKSMLEKVKSQQTAETTEIKEPEKKIEIEAEKPPQAPEFVEKKQFPAEGLKQEEKGVSVRPTSFKPPSLAPPGPSLDRKKPIDAKEGLKSEPRGFIEFDKKGVQKIPKPEESIRTLEESIHEQEKSSEIKLEPDKMGIELNPEDFLVKPRPKIVTTVPKDAKAKLKTSPFAQVTNPEASKPPVTPVPTEPIKPKKEIVPIPPRIKEMAPTKNELKKPVIPTQKKEIFTPPISSIPQEPIKPSIPIDPTKIVPPKEIRVPQKPAEAIQPTKTPEEKKPPIETPEKASSAMNEQQKSNIEKSLVDLKIKKASISKMALDFDMKELTGELTAEELEEKKERLKRMEAEINKQIKELEDLLKS
ncbi:MAG: ADP-ribosylation factor-like protein [Promethearchaeota archaeon]